MRYITLIITGLLLFSCENIDLSKYGEIFPISYSTSKNEIVYTPQKDVYKVEEMIGIAFSFSPMLLDKNDKAVHIQDIAKKLPEKVVVEFPYRWKEDTSMVHIVLNGKKLESLGRITFIYDKDKDRYILADNLALFFHKKGTYLLSDIFNFTDFRLNRQDFLSVNQLISEQQLTIEE
ncbi:hypothetical protein [Capnocytophaga cynodegmi]|uniref:hypothetical protein n=1 Tax=Capnocytophaga cynodegmi TaxID=28189 RepID=UPI00385DA823